MVSENCRTGLCRCSISLWLHFFLTGRAVDKDEAEAAKWLAKAAEQGHANAQFYLGSAYTIGTGVKQDYVQAYKWVSLGLAQGKGDKEALPALIEKMTREQIEQGEGLLTRFKAMERKP